MSDLQPIDLASRPYGDGLKLLNMTYKTTEFDLGAGNAATPVNVALPEGTVAVCVSLVTFDFSFGPEKKPVQGPVGRIITGTLFPDSKTTNPGNLTGKTHLRLDLVGWLQSAGVSPDVNWRGRITVCIQCFGK